MNVVELVISVIAPHKCIICGSRGQPLCVDCTERAIKPLISRCALCNSLINDFRTCQVCRQKTALRHVWSVTSYESVQAVVQAYKFDGKRSLAMPMALQMREVVMFGDYELIVAVPTAPSRIRTRSFDHAQLLAKQVSKSLAVPLYQPLLHCGKQRQVGVSRRKRFSQAADAYQLKADVAHLANKRILLVDDVITTGATLSACAGLLKSAGAKSVDAVTFARKI